MLTFMSHPETTCSSSHLRACSSVGKCWLVFRKPSWPYSCGGHPGTAPSMLPNAAAALEAASGFQGARCLWVWTHLGDRGPVVRTSHYCSAPVGSPLTSLCTTGSGKCPRSPGQWVVPLEFKPGPLTPQSPSFPTPPPPHPTPQRLGMARAKERGPAHTPASYLGAQGGLHVPPLPVKAAMLRSVIFIPPKPCQITLSRPALWRYFLGFAIHAVTNTCYILKTSLGKNLS